MRKLFIDDIRSPPDSTFDVIRSSAAAKEYVLANTCPDYISFDHDLGSNDTSMLFIHWLIELDMSYSIIPEGFTYSIHSQNPVGAANIRGLLDSYFNYKENYEKIPKNRAV